MPIPDLSINSQIFMKHLPLAKYFDRHRSFYSEQKFLSSWSLYTNESTDNKQKKTVNYVVC